MADKKESGTVTVACKLPKGLILRIFDMVDAVEASPQGGRPTKRAQANPKTVRIWGNRFPDGVQPPCRIVGGYALTEGVPAEFFSKWFDQNKDSDLVLNDLVFGEASNEAVASKARKLVETKSGLEPLDPKNLPKGLIPKDMNIGVSQIETADMKAA